jgi:hypothetical protein
MPLVFPTPFPNENAQDPVEAYRFGRAIWLRMQKFRAGQFTLSQLVTAGTTVRATLIDVSVGGSDTGIDNTVAGMYVTVTPPAAIPAGVQVDYAFVAAAGNLTLQLRNGTGGDLTAAGTWSYLGYTY